ncbi:MAG: lysylphosphatidylglycerol synthase transmembrane domain-containing protein, partial [Candidatus Woesearchaeota archaeon]|nr:lysylphosphatidylglycerol synthase transmembrane domain-containing protein [Candidatus Woesearchaeota archaeon]
MKLGKKINLALAAMITIALLYFLISNVSVSSIIMTLSRMSWMIILAGFLLYIASYFFRALRFWLLLDRRIPLKRLFSITAVHNLVNSILPARTGELSYVYLVKNTKKAKATEGIATLVVARVFDFLSVAMIFFLSIFLAQGLPSYVTGAAKIIALFFFVLVAFIAGLILYSSSAEKIFATIEMFSEKSGSKWL